MTRSWRSIATPSSKFELPFRVNLPEVRYVSLASVTLPGEWRNALLQYVTPWVNDWLDVGFNAGGALLGVVLVRLVFRARGAGIGH